MGLSFTIAAGPRHRSFYQVIVPRNSWSYFIVSDSRLPQPRSPSPRIYIPPENGGPVIPPDTGFPFHCLLRLAGLRWRYSNPPPHGMTSLAESESESESYITIDGQSTSLSWNKAPIWGLRPDCQTVAGLLICSAPSDETTGLSFTISAGPRQRSYSLIPVHWDLRSYLLPQIRDFLFVASYDS
jgi:hypothetical protein